MCLPMLPGEYEPFHCLVKTAREVWHLSGVWARHVVAGADEKMALTRFNNFQVEFDLLWTKLFGLT